MQFILISSTSTTFFYLGYSNVFLIFVV